MEIYGTDVNFEQFESASCLIAAHQLGHKFLGFEIDEDYYAKAKKRLDGAMAQKNIFDFL